MSIRFAFAVVLGCILASSAHAQEGSPSVDPDREVIVMFRPGTVIRPPGVVAGRLGSFVIRDPQLLQLLTEARVESVAQVVAGFEPEDRFAVSLSGEPVELTDWSHTFLLRVPGELGRAELLAALQRREDVVYAENNVRGEPDDLPLSPAERLTAVLGLGRGPLSMASGSPLLTPNDQFFPQQWALKNDGTGPQGSGTFDADVDADEAWDITTGSSAINIAVVDEGMQTNHPDFTGRVTGDAGDSGPHGTKVAGVAAAQGNNGIGIAGVAWNVGIINEDYGNNPDATAFVDAVRSAYNRGAHVINSSWRITPTGTYSFTVRLAFADAYRVGSATVASMGNQAQTGEPETQYPAAFGQGLITVGATTNTDVRAAYSSRGPHLDVSAPGGEDASQAQSSSEYVLTTFPGSTYDFTNGTSFSTPAVSGVVALLRSARSDLRPDDIEAILRISAEDRGDPGFDNEYGAGRVNARRALDLVRAPNLIRRGSGTGGTVYASTAPYTWSISAPGMFGTYQVKRYEVRRTFTVSGYSGTWHAWGLGEGSDATGWNIENPNAGLKNTRIVGQTSNSVTVSTYVYELWSPGGSTYYGYYPTTPQNVRLAYATVGTPLPLSVAINGPSTVVRNQSATWTDGTTGGVTPYSRLWETFFPCVPPPCDPTICLTEDPAPSASRSSAAQASLAPQDPACGVWNNGGTAGAFTTTVYTAPSFQLRLSVTDAASGSGVVTRTVTTTSGSSLDGAAASDGVTANARSAADVVTDLVGAEPNPTRGAGMVRFSLAEAGDVRIVLYDALGREVARLVDAPREAGEHTVPVDAAGLSPGIYVVRMDAGTFSAARRLTLIR